MSGGRTLVIKKVRRRGRREGRLTVLLVLLLLGISFVHRSDSSYLVAAGSEPQSAYVRPPETFSLPREEQRRPPGVPYVPPAFRGVGEPPSDAPPFPAFSKSEWAASPGRVYERPDTLPIIPEPVPELGTCALLAAGGSMLALRRRRPHR